MAFYSNQHKISYFIFTRKSQPMITISKPQTGMYKPFSGSYINLVNDNISVADLQNEFDKMKAFLLSIPKEKWQYQYAEGKWTIKEMLVHMIDTERIFSYRALRMARNDTTPLAGFEQNDYVPFSNANNRDADDIIKEFEAARMSSYLLFKSFDDAAWNKSTLVDNHPVSVRAELYLIIGHALHHLKVIRERYL